jgi:hypothetical protein
MFRRIPFDRVNFSTRFFFLSLAVSGLHVALVLRERFTRSNGWSEPLALFKRRTRSREESVFESDEAKTDTK